MKRTSGVAAIAAAILFAAFGTLNATPTMAWQIDLPAPAPAVVTTLPDSVIPPAPAAPAPAAAPAQVDKPSLRAKADTVRLSLAQMVAERPDAAAADAEQQCLATAVYFEAKSESLRGQLGVAHVILNRAHSGRFPRSLCGVVRQAGQFSFVHGGRMPHVPGCAQWRTALAIAAVALSGEAPAPAPNALFFHARSVSPGWHLVRVAAIGNHVFYR